MATNILSVKFLVRAVVVIALIFPTGFIRANQFIRPNTFNDIEKYYGKKAKIRLKKLEILMNSLQNATIKEKLIKVNDFFDNPAIITWDSDLNVWNKNDYWATRFESLGKGRGDCEDYVIAKYLTLKSLGVPTNRMYFTYVFARVNGTRQAHMVLSYFPTPKSVPLILGSLTSRILPATQRTDLTPVYSFNADSLYLAKQQGLGQFVPNGNRQNPAWLNFLRRIKGGDL